jgi:putative ABC transport system substrate-binding protein
MRWQSLTAVLVFAVLASPLAPGAQQTGQTYRIGVLSPGSASLTTGREAFLQRLHELGWTLGQNVLFEARYADGHLDRLPDLAADLA